MANIEKIFKRENGTETRVMIWDFTAPWSSKPEFQTDVFTREIGDKNWSLISDTVRKDERRIHNMFSFVSPTELIKTISLFLEQYKRD